MISGGEVDRRSSMKSEEERDERESIEEAYACDGSMRAVLK